MDKASRKQRQFERKYSSYKRYTATEDVNYRSHSARSTYREESLTSRTTPTGRSSSTEIKTGTETRTLPVYIAIQDYIPDESDPEAIPLEQGQIVEVLDNKNASAWLIRTKARPPRTGWVPGSYFETPTEYYKQRRRTRELTSGDLKMSEEQEAILKRDQVYHDLLHTEEEFVSDLRNLLDTYVAFLDGETVPSEVQKKKSNLLMNIKEIYNFHANVMLKGLQYYSDDPGKVGQTFVRLEHDFDHHVQFHRDLPHVLRLIEEDEAIKTFLQNISDKVEAGAKSYVDYLTEIGDRVKQYSEFFKEIIKYTARAQCSTRSMQKALEVLTSIPKRADDAIFTKNIVNYPGDPNRLGRIFRHDLFQVWEGDLDPEERYLFLFKNKLMITKRDDRVEPATYTHYATIRLDKYTIRQYTMDEDAIVLKPNDEGLPLFRTRAKDLLAQEFVRKAWLKDMLEMQEAMAQETENLNESALPPTEYEMQVSESKTSESMEYTTTSRKSSLMNGPDEGPPRKKIKSPPVISPTGSSTSLYSGGSSIDWTTTGTTLEMQGTRVTRTQYGFRTLQESSAKMCLKVTGYPLPEITWYKDDQLLKEDERHSFYADEDGFFAMTIDPVHVDDTGRYTCVATNEYGQASTSAFFRVLKVEKEAAPPAFTTTLKDMECKEGEVVSFDCEVEGWPEPELVWLVDDQPLRPSHDFRLEYDGQSAKLQIRDAQPEDTGVYAVKITNEYGVSESKAQLVVQPDPDKNHVAPEFQSVVEDAECNEGDTVRFKSVLTGDPTPEVIWFINGVPLTESEKVKMINEDGICILTIKDVPRNFDGTVTCQGQNRLGATSCEGKLHVRVPAMAPQFDKPLEDRTVTEKTMVAFDCEVSGYPEPKLEFLVNGKPIAHGQDGVEIQVKDVDVQTKHFRIVIQETDINKHDGEILARATNEHGQAESRARLVVEPEEEESRSAPTFIKDIEDQTVKFGEKAVFETSVRGNPAPNVKWFINGAPLDANSPGVVIESSGNDHKLTIDSTHYAGTVLCRAENSVGRFETKARLIVLPAEKKKKAPTFKEQLKDKAENEGNSVIFEVEVDAEPNCEYIWTLNGQRLVENDRVKFREFNGSSKVEIKDLKLEEAGKISCTARNSEGEATTEAVLTVNKKPKAPVFDQKPKNLTVERGQEAAFEARADGISAPTYQWSVGGRKIKETTHGARIETTENGGTRLILDTNAFYESATISITAENASGVDETGCLMTIEEPKIEPPQKKTKLEEEKLAEQGAEKLEGLEEAEGIEAGKPSETAKMEQVEAMEEHEIKVETFEAQTAKEPEPSKLKEKPEFTQKLTDITVKEEETIREEVIATNEPTFKWSLDGKPLQDGVDGVKITTEGNKSTLTIEKASQDHKGRITVEAVNEAGSAESSSQIRVETKSVPAKIVEGPKSIMITEKETIEFTTVVTGIPEPKVRWELNEKVVEEHHESITITKQENKHTLKIANVKAEQAGRIEVIAENEAGSDRAQAKVEVKGAETKPEFKSTLKDSKVDEGSPLRLDVELENPTPGTKVSWFLNDNKLEESDNVKVVDDGDGKHHLEIKNVTPDMQGTITCKAENPAGSAETKGKLEVVSKSQKPEFAKVPQDHVSEEENSVKFSAIVTGIPTPTVSWYLNEQLIVSNEEIRVKYDEETGKTSIRIFKPNVGHSGKVRVKAENKAGQAEATAQLKVEKKGVLPNFLSDLKDRQVNENTDVKFTAKIAAYPEPEVTWTLNDQPIKADNAKMTREGDVYTLEFTKVQLDQAGEIGCMAKNAVGHAKQNCSLIVKEVGQAPIFSKYLEDKLVEENETLIMEAKLEETKPKPTVEWFKDGKPLESDDHVKLKQEPDGTLKLTIIRTELTDKSRITIKAENAYGAAETSASIGVQKKRPQKKPEFLSTIAPITITEGDTLNTKVIISGDPEPYAKWYINNIMVYQTEDTEIKNENGVYSLTIHGCTTDMTGTIKCVAGNKMGEASTEGKLTVIAPIPVEFETSLCDATCREGDTLKLKAVLLGEPTPVVTWYVNGKKLEESQNIKIHAEKGTYTVTIKDITCDYSGKVVCEAVNEFGKASSEATLLVLPRGEPPDFLEWLSNIRARPGTVVNHKVVFTGDPKPTLTWYINGKEVRDGEDGITIKTDDKTSILTIQNFQPEKHVGEIICKAENDAGEVSCTANMATYTSDMASESESDAVAEDIGKEEDLTENEESLREEIQRTPTPVNAPKFITKIKDTKVKKGQTAVFECVVPDTKGVCCKWLKDGKEIELLARIRVQTRTIEGYTTNELIIDDVVPEDAGKYTVIVENAAGMAQCEASLTVLEDLTKPSQKEPEFIVKLSDKTINESEKVVFECKVVGEPEPQVKWFHETKEVIKSEERVTIESTANGTQRLIVENVKQEDKGKYVCQAENVVGSSKTEATLTVLAEPPQFTRTLKDQVVKLGEQIILECSVRGVPQPTLEFFSALDSTKLTTSSRVSIQHDETNTHWRVVIKNSVETDFESYKAVAVNAWGSAESVAEVKKEVTEEKPTIDQGLKNTSVREGETAEMSVKVAGHPPPEVEWSKDGENIAPDGDRIEVVQVAEEQVTEHKLVIHDAKPEDTGEYVAKVKNEVGEEESKGQLTVEEKDQAPEFTKKLQEVKTTEKQTIEMEVALKGKPQPDVQWFKDGQPVNVDNSHILVKSTEEGQHTLVIKDALLSDAGTYTCKATNKAGTAETSAPVTVEEETQAPEFVKIFRDVKINEKQTIELDVTVRGKPEPKVEWFKDGKPLQVDGQHIIVKEYPGGDYTLVIQKTKLEDTGVYSCKATNKAGSDETSATITVEEKLELPKIEGLKDVEVKESEMITFNVSVSGGVPEPEVKWYKDGGPLVIDAKYSVIKSGGKYMLTIKSATLEDAGSYSCKATNKAGTAETTGKLTVLEKLIAPQITDKLKSIEVKEGETAELTLGVTGKPEPAIEWLKDGKPVEIDNEHLKVKDQDGKHTLVIENARKEDIGAYTVKATNKAGEVESQAKVAVVEEMKAPKFVDKLEPLEVKEHETAEFSVTVTGKPEPEVQWFRNGAPINVDNSHVFASKDDQGHYTLKIQDARLADAGAISCKAFNKIGAAESSAKFGVLQEESGPKFTEGLQPIEIKEGESADLAVHVEGKPEPTVEWFKDGHPVQIDNSHVLRKDEPSGDHSISIKNARLQDAGTYSCKATNPVGSDETSGKLSVAEESEAPKFTEKLSDAEVEEGKSLNLECAVVGKPEPEVHWFKDGQPVKIDNSQIFSKDDSEGHHSLSIKDARKEDAGRYTCEAVNRAGKDTTTAEVKFPKYGFEKVPEEGTQDIKPHFIEPLHQTTVIEGETVTLTAKVNEESHSEIHWYKDGKLVDLNFVSSHIKAEQQADGTVKLIIKDAASADAGSYTCEAENRAGKDETSARLDLKYAQESTITQEQEESALLGFTKPLQDQTAKVGEPVEFECKLETTPGKDVQIEWSKDGKTPEEAKTESLPDGTQKLVIDEVAIDDAGSYKCKASVENESVFTEARLYVSGPSEVGPQGPPEFIELLKSATTTINGEAILKCKVKGEPRPKIKWTKEGKEVEMATRIATQYLDDGTIILSIKQATMEDSGEYRCEAVNEFGSAWTEAPVIVVKEGTIPTTGEAPDFLEPVRPVTVVQGDTAVLEGKITGSPAPEVKWYRGKDLITPATDARYKVDNLPDGTVRLTIKDAKIEDMGEFRCEASNEYGDVWSDVTLTVKLPHEVEGGAEEYTAPSFVKSLEKVEITESEEAQFEVQVTGEPKPEVKWFKDSKEIKADEKHFVQSQKEDGTARLTIPTAELNDAGVFSCEAKNIAGTAKTEAPLKVHPAAEEIEMEVESAPEFLQALKPVQVKEGEPAIFECKVSGEPMPTIQWFKDGKPITDGPGMHIETRPDGTCKLVIDKATKEDQGDYECVATNNAGSQKSKAPLTVTPSEKLRIKRGLEDQNVNTGVKILLSVEVEGKPKTVKWFKGKDEIKASRTTKLEKVTEEEYKLEIEKAELSDSGPYRVVLSNETESVESSCTVTVTEGAQKPSFKKGLSDQTVPKGSPLTLEIEVEGKPTKVKWLKDGKPVDESRAKPVDLGNGKYALKIADMQDEDFGKYTVQISNEVGEAESSGAVKEAAAKPEIVKGLQPATVNAGEPAVFEVEVKGPVKQVKWYKNGKELTDAKTEEVAPGKYRLTIPSAKSEDQGDYKVVLSNDAGQADSSAALTVKLPSAEPLKFVRGLEDKVANKGDKVVLEIETNKKPKTIKWYKNGNEITPKDQAEPKKVSDTVYQLVVPDADLEDSGEFRVVVTNEDDVPSDSYCALTVKLPPEEPAEPPRFVKGLEDQTIPIGAPLTLEIETTGKPKTVRWYKNGKELAGAAAAKVKIEKIDDNRYKLTIPKSALDDSGEYAVEIENSAGKAKSEGRVTVEPVPEFLKPLRDLEVTEGEKAEFQIETNCRPRTVKWYKNSQEIAPDARIEFKGDDTKYSLVIKEAKKEDAGTYKVVIENTAGQKDSSAKLTVKKPLPDQPRIIKGLEDQIVAKGDAIIFEVKVAGEVNEIVWLKDGKKVANATIEKIDDQTYRLTIPKSEVSDAGKYEVQAINEAGKATSSANAEVDEKPEIVKGLIPANIDEGDDHVFRVEVSKPVRQVKWYKNGQEIKPDGRMATRQVSPKKYELIINKAFLDDGAEYKVVLSNRAGECDSSAELTVTKPNILKILKGLEDVTVNEGEPFELSCKIQGTPKTVTWLKNGEKIGPSDKVTVKANPETGEYSISVPESTIKDGGAYRVIFKNERGEVHSGAVAHVKAAKKVTTSPAKFLSPLQDTEIPEGETLTLKCQVGGEPQPQVKWYKNGQELAPDSRTSIRLGLDGTATLRIRDAKKSDEGEYSVEATNEAGTDSSSCKATVIPAKEEPSPPKFVIPLRSKEVAPGSAAEFNVKLRGNPKPTLAWLLNDTPIVIDDARISLIDMHDGHWTLKVKDFKESDYGTLKCVAKNEHGVDECTAVVKPISEKPRPGRDEEGYPPRFNVPLWDRRIPEGQMTWIECHVDAKPRADILWEKDGEEVKESEYLRIENTPEGACKIKIHKFLAEQIGTYKCTASNIYGVAETEGTLRIETQEFIEEEKKKECAPKFNPPLEDKILNAGQILTLRCTVHAIPTASIVWYKDGLPVRRSDKLIWDYNPETGECKLTISDVTDADQGAYRCVASNTVGSTNTACNVTVKTKREEAKKVGAEPYFTKGLTDKWVDRGETLVLQCAVTGDPEPTIKWYRNGILLRPSNRVSIEKTPDGQCTLTVKDCTMSDEGIYRVEATNQHGSAKTQGTAHVQMTLGKVDKKREVLGEAPRFVIPLEDLTMNVGSAIELECKVTGQPMPQVKWTKDGSSLLEDHRFDWNIDAKTGHYKLRISNSTTYDEGTYRVVAINESGSASTKAMIRVNDGGLSTMSTLPSLGARDEKAAAPRFAVKLGDARAQEGQPLILECKVEGFPLPELTWYKDGEKVYPSDQIKFESSPDGSFRLIIPSCKTSDEGIYRVIATNPSGSAHDKANATVRKTPGSGAPSERASVGPEERFDVSKAPKLITPLESIRVPEKQAFTLKCKFSGDPKPSIKWFKDGERIYSFPHCQLTEHDDGTCELTVDAAQMSDAGNYRCMAENTYGSVRTSGQVTVTQKEKKPQKTLEDQLKEGNAPGFTIPLTMKKSKIGETVVFECLPYGNPFPEIKWLKDGMEIPSTSGAKIEALPDSTQRLTLANVETLSEGYYRCVATNSYGTASTKAELEIIGDRRPKTNGVSLTNGGPSGEPEESKPKIKRGLYPMSIHQGQPVEMQVVATGWPTPTVKWYKDGVEIVPEGPESKRVIWTDERNVHHLLILNAMPEDEGEYSLVATNKLGEAKTEGGLSIIRPREVQPYEDGLKDGTSHPPGFIRQLKNKHVFSHMPTIFDCLVVGHPAPQVDWYHNGQKILPGGRYKIQSAPGGSHALIILDTLPEDAGEYVAIAKNSHGQASSSAVLDVTVPHLDSIKFDGSFDVTPYLTEEYGFRKLNIHSLPTPPDRGPFIKEVTGHYLTLSWIPTKRSPPRYPQVTYVVEIRELPYKEWSLLEYNIPEPVCKVRNLELGKSYQFRVRAENIYGISDPSPASPPSRLMARPQPVMDRNKKIIPLLDPYAEKALDELYSEQYACAPWFAPGVVDKRYCAENDTLIITLSVSGYPDPKIQWKFRGWDVDTSSPTSNIRVSNYGGAETTLTVFGFSKSNAGQYQCVATNPYGEATQSIFVEVATRPNFIQPLINKTFSDGKQMKLDVRVEGTPFPEIKWMKEWHPLAESSRIKFVQDGPYLCSLVIDNPIWRDCGIYSCVAINPAGQASTSCSVTIEAENEVEIEIPKKKIALEARKVREVYEIEEEDEKKAAAGAPFRVIERATGKRYIGQLKPLDDDLKRNLAMHNILEDPGMVQIKQAISDQGLAVVVFENADRSLFDNLLAPVPTNDDQGEDVCGKKKEDQVRVFVKQLLTAVQYMHHRNIAHLDLRPEDDHLRLADFGQSRHLLRGKVSGDIKGSPEFVSPEVVMGKTVTLAADMWSSGVLTYVLLSGSSPFLGDNDNETLTNVVHGQYTLDIPELGDVSADAKDFLNKLLVVDQFKRLTVDEALAHLWLADPALKDAKLAVDCLREFKYRHKWLERRVFVQQTPSAELTQFIEAPLPSVAEVNKINGYQQGQAEPRAIYDYLKIKDAPKIQTNGSKQIDPRKAAQLRQALLQGRTQNGDLPPPAYPGHFDPSQLPPGARLPPGVRPEDLRFGPPPFNGQQGGHPLDPRLQRYAPFDQMGPLPGGRPGAQGEQDRRRLVPQDKGETPSQNGHLRQQPKKQQSSQVSPGVGPDYVALVSQEDGLEDIIPVPTRLVRGEHREIEEEIANRILSDISEENSVAGSLASIDEIEHMLPKLPRDRKSSRGGRKSRSRSSTPKAEASDMSETPLASPAPTVDSIDPIVQFFGDHVPAIPELQDPKVPVGAPLFLEGLSKHVTMQEGPRPKTPSSLSPRPNTPGTKSPIMLSPGREYQMECVIATKRGKQGKTEPLTEEAGEIKPDDAGAEAKKAQMKIHDREFDNLMDEVERIRKKHQAERNMLDDLEKYRPKNFYKDQDLEFNKPEIGVDDFPWESNYQIGPDTFLLATKGPAFNARVRQYREELWGSGAPLVRQGILGYRNQDITVRERRRFTDLLREDPEIAKKPEPIIPDRHATPGGAVHRMQQDIKKLSPIVTRKNPDGTFGAIFRSRLRDTCLKDGANQVALECYAMGNPQPQVMWYFHERPLADDAHYKITREGDLCRLTILNPTSRDVGEYTCVASNEHGADKCYARLMSGRAPDRPGRPTVELSSDTEVFITWEAPDISTCLEGIVYKLECRPAGDKDYNAPWTVISEDIETEAIVVKHLNPMGIYQFRVTAGNGFGWGIPSLTSRIIRTHMRGAPKLHVDVLQAEVHLTVVSMPQRTSRTSGFTAISEQDEEDEESEEMSEGSTKSEHQPLFLNTSDDPTQRFQLANELFRGKFSIVRNAVDTKSRNQKHCVAKIRIAKSGEMGVTDEFENLKECQHENVVKLNAGYHRENFLLLFTEKLHENVFERFTYLEYYNEEQITLVVRQIASALHWIHFRGIVHLDVQPNNVMFISKRAWQVKLIDFENSQLIGSNVKKPENPNPEWAAPETLKDDGQLTAQTDVWGLGIITFCLLAGFHPFSSDDDTVEEVKENVLKQKCDPNLIPVQASQEALIFATHAIKKNHIRRIRTDEALAHRWLSNDAAMTQRREGVKYNSNRLRKTIARTMKRPRVEPDSNLVAKYGAKK